MPQPAAVPQTSSLVPLTVSIDDTMVLTGLSRSTVNRLLSAGKITARKAGRIVLVEYASVRDYLASLPSFAKSSPA